MLLAFSDLFVFSGLLAVFCCLLLSFFVCCLVGWFCLVCLGWRWFVWGGVGLVGVAGVVVVGLFGWGGGVNSIEVPPNGHTATVPHNCIVLAVKYSSC